MPIQWMSAAEIAAVTNPVSLVPGFLNVGERAILAGPEKVGKSFLLLQAAFELAHGLPLWGTFTASRPLRVFLLQFEISPAAFKGRYQDYVDLLGASDNLWVASDRNFRIDNDTHLADLQRDVAAYSPDLLIVDPLYYVTDQPENTDAMREVFRRVDTLVSDCAVFIIHHMRKPLHDATGRVVTGGRSDIRGHSVILGWPDIIVEIRRGHMTEDGLSLTYTFRNQAPVEPTELMKQGGLFTPAPMLTTMGVLHRLRAAGGTLPVGRLAGSRIAVDRMVSELVHDGLVADNRGDNDRRGRTLSLTAAGAIVAAPQRAGE